MRKLLVSIITAVLATCCVSPVHAFYEPTTAMQCVLRAVEEGSANYQETIDVSNCHITATELTENFWEASAGYIFRDLIESFTYQYDSASVKNLRLIYRFDELYMDNIRTEFDEQVDQLLESLDPRMSELDKLFYVHNYLAVHTSYDSATAKATEASGLSHVDSKYAISFSTVGPLVEGKAVCSGYAQAYMYILQQLGIESKYITSTKMNHGWNLVNYQGNWYHVDVTYDDPIPDRLNYVDYTYFMVNDTEMRQSHTWDDHSLPSTQTSLADTKYIFNQDIQNATYYDGYWYYVKDHRIARSHIDSTDFSWVNTATNVMNIFMDGNTIYYTTANDSYSLNSIYETDTNNTYQAEIATLSKGTYGNGFYYADDQMYVTTHSGSVERIELERNETVQGHIVAVQANSNGITGTVQMQVEYYDATLPIESAPRIVLRGTSDDIVADTTLSSASTVSNSATYLFHIATEDIGNDTYTIQLQYQGKLYEITSQANAMEYQEDSMRITYDVTTITVEGNEAFVPFDLSAYSDYGLNVYENSRVTAITPSSKGFTVAGYMWIDGVHATTNTWREIIFVNADDSDTFKAYRQSVKPVYNTWLNTNIVATKNHTIRLDYANYEVAVDPTSIQNYTKTSTGKMASGTYLVYMRISDGKNSYLFPLIDRELSDGSTMESTGTLPTGFSVADKETRTLIYTIK